MTLEVCFVQNKRSPVVSTNQNSGADDIAPDRTTYSSNVSCFCAVEGSSNCDCSAYCLSKLTGLRFSKRDVYSIPVSLNGELYTFTSCVDDLFATFPRIIVKADLILMSGGPHVPCE